MQEIKVRKTDYTLHKNHIQENMEYIVTLLMDATIKTLKVISFMERKEQKFATNGLMMLVYF